MSKFTILMDSCTIGFHRHVSIDILEPIEEQLERIYIIPGQDDCVSTAEIRKVIENNSSLRVYFGWSFESATFYKQVMYDCLREILPRLSILVGELITDLRCSWLGFSPYNVFEKNVYENLDKTELILFNENLIKYQTDVIKFISNHRIFRQHALLRDNTYRFSYIKEKRNNPALLSSVFEEYMCSVNDICGLNKISRDLIEDQIGCHFLNYPDLFFELLEFSILRGTIYED